MASPLRIGNAQGFWGDRPGAASELLLQQPNLDYITLDYLSEVSLSIMAIQQEKEHTAGYAKDFLDVVREMLPFWRQGSQVKVVTNAGGLNPLACGKACKEIIFQEGGPSIPIGVVYGDNVLEQLAANPADPLFSNLENKASLHDVCDKLVTANAYLGAEPIVQALKQGAKIVVAGRVADPSLTVAPCIAHYGWSFTDYDLIAQATVAGHLIECGTQVTGGISCEWLSLANKANIAFPFVEMNPDGSFVITKPQAAGGKVNRHIVLEQLLYEIGDPSAYLSPDAIVSFLSLKIAEIGFDRVLINGATGRKPPSTYKVSATYHDGWKAEAFLALFGNEVAKKGRLAGEMILQRMAQAGYQLERSVIECLGCGDLVCGILPEPKDIKECVLRIAVADSRKAACELFAKEIAPLVTAGPPGLTGYTSGRPHLRQVFGYWPCLIERAHVFPKMEILP